MKIQTSCTGLAAVRNVNYMYLIRCPPSLRKKLVSAVGFEPQLLRRLCLERSATDRWPIPSAVGGPTRKRVSLLLWRPRDQQLQASSSFQLTFRNADNRISRLIKRILRSHPISVQQIKSSLGDLCVSRHEQKTRIYFF